MLFDKQIELSTTSRYQLKCSEIFEVLIYKVLLILRLLIPITNNSQEIVYHRLMCERVC